MTARDPDVARILDAHLGHLQRVTRAFSEALGLTDVRHVLHSALADAVGASRVHLGLASDLGNDPPSNIGDARRGAHEGPDVPGEAVKLLDAVNASGAARWPTPSSPLVALPLTLGARRLGAVVFELNQVRELSAAERALFDDLTRQLALSLDRAQLHEAAKQECARAEEAYQAKDELLAMLGHELRNPLSPMLTAITLMQSRLGDVALKERQVIERQLNHMMRLVDDLLDVSRVTRGSLRLTKKPTELSNVVERALEMASPMLDDRGHTLTVAVPAAGLPVRVDSHRIAQAIANLVVNAAKYTPNGGSIEVRAKASDRQVMLSVSDDGIGIDSSLLRRVFEPFIQRQQPLDRQSGGLGLGLTIARRLVELHGGVVTATSPGPGAGSTFTIELALDVDLDPIETSAPAPDSAPRSWRSSGGDAEAPASAARGVRVLVVDDNVDAAEMLGEALRLGGQVVCVAHDGPSALALVDKFRPELALLDIGLPVMDGFDLARRLKARLGSAAPTFVAVTGYGRPADRARTKQVGFDEHLVKPVDLARLASIVQSVARRRS